MSKIIVVGASGTIGRAVADLLGQTHQVIRVGNRQGDDTVDLSSKASIEKVFERIGTIDAAICAAGLSQAFEQHRLFAVFDGLPLSTMIDDGPQIRY